MGSPMTTDSMKRDCRSCSQTNSLVGGHLKFAITHFIGQDLDRILGEVEVDPFGLLQNFCFGSGRLSIRHGRNWLRTLHFASPHNPNTGLGRSNPADSIAGVDEYHLGA